MKTAKVHPAVLTVLLVIVGLGLGLILSFLIEPAFRGQREEMSIYYTIRMMAIFGNITVLLFILPHYFSTYKELRAPFTVGLIFVFTVLLIQNVLALPVLHMMFGFSGARLGPFMFIPETLELIALAVLYYLSQ